MSTERVFNHGRRKCEQPDACNWPVCDCRPVPEPEIVDNRPAIHAEQKRHLREKTVRVKSVLP